MRDRVILSMLGGSNSARSGSVSWAWRERVIDVTYVCLEGLDHALVHEGAGF